MKIVSFATDTLCTLVKICGQLGSDQPGIRAAAAAKAHEFVRRQGWTWREVIMPSAPALSPEPVTNGEIVVWLLEREEQLSAKELDFLHNIVGRAHRISELQQDWLSGIYDRIRGRSE